MLFSGNLKAQDEVRKQWDHNELTFSEFVSVAESLYSIRFFYKEEWVREIRTGSYKGNYTLTDLLDTLLNGTSLYYYVDRFGNVIITRNFRIRVSDEKILNESNFIPPSDYSDRQEDNELSGNVFIDIGNPADKNKPGDVVLSGYISDGDTKEPVAGATVFIEKSSAGTMSNEYGFYTIQMPRGSHQVQVSFIGMKERKLNINLYGPGELNLEMHSTLIPLKEAVVSAQKNVIFQRYEVGVEKISISSLKLLPTPMGEIDIFKSVLLIPGVQSVGEGSTGFNVRGGSADQNLILIYGAPVYNSSHFFGFFSAVNSDIIRDVTLYKGGIPSRYGGRIASVLDIVAAEGSRNEFHGRAGISPVTTQLMVEGPLIKDTLSILLTGRTTYSNWIFKLIDDPSLKNSRASFNDLNGKITYDLNKNNKIDISSYFSHDDFRLNSDTTYGYTNSIVALKWRHFFNSRFFSVFSVNNSNYRYNISSQRVMPEAFVLSHNINSTAFKSDFNLYKGRNELNFGFDATRYMVNPGSYMPSGDSSIVISDVIEKEKALEAALYIDDKFVLTDYLSINAGLRFSSFFTAGPKSVLIYDPSYSRSRSTVTDTISYKSNELFKKYGGPEFRLSLNFRISKTSSLKVNYNRTRQYLHLLSNTTSISPSDTWKLSDYYLKPQIGDQYALGFYQILPKGIEASAEVYYKGVKNMVDYKGGTNLIMNRYIETDLVNVQGEAYGAEIMVRKAVGRTQWSVAYTYARTFLKSVGTFTDEMINSGKWFPANFDKPNDLITSISYVYSRRMSVSANYVWSTGRPITYPVATYYTGDHLLIHYSERNKYRIPDYSRLDLSIKINGDLKSRKIAHPYWTFSVYNVLGRQNVYSIYFKNENNVINGYKLSVFGRAIPSLSYNFDF